MQECIISWEYEYFLMSRIDNQDQIGIIDNETAIPYHVLIINCKQAIDVIQNA